MHDVAKVFVADIQSDQEVAGVFIVAEKQLRTARNGKPFLTLRLADKTGEIIGRIWDRASELNESIAARSVVFVRGRSETFRDEMQLQVREVQPVALEEVQGADFLPVCPRDTQQLWEQFKQLCGQVKRRPLQKLLAAISGDAELMERFRRAPAAKSMHHAYLGGLLEHTVGVTELVLRICEQYPDLDRDLLSVGGILHDLGKIHEFVYDIFIDYSHEGRLLGHMVQGLVILDEKVRTLKTFPEEEVLLLKHLILSHHGETEFGAVKLPMTREAFVLHHADDLDAKMNSLTRILAESKAGDESWTTYQPLFERFFFRGLPPIVREMPIADASTREQSEPVKQLRVWPVSTSREDTKAPRKE
jgi:3'-5' exoribonuclease